jgi:hypothetical protein
MSLCVVSFQKNAFFQFFHAENGWHRGCIKGAIGSIETVNVKTERKIDYDYD